MKKPQEFEKTFGVLNVGMTVVTFLYVLVGFVSYMKYGNGVHGSVTLDLPKDEMQVLNLPIMHYEPNFIVCCRLAQTVKVMISLGILFTFALQFYIPIDIMFPAVSNRFGPFKHPVFTELAFRAFFVLVTCKCLNETISRRN